MTLNEKYTSEEKEEKQSMSFFDNLEDALDARVEMAEEMYDFFKERKKQIALGMIGLVGVVYFASYFAKPQKEVDKINEKAKIENTIKLEYQNEKSKLDSAYNSKRDSLQKVYENKLEEKVK